MASEEALHLLVACTGGVPARGELLEDVDLADSMLCRQLFHAVDRGFCSGMSKISVSVDMPDRIALVLGHVFGNCIRDDSAFLDRTNQ